MKTAAFEALIENGIIRLLEPRSLPDHTRVIVVIPELPEDSVPQQRSPRLVYPADFRDLQKVVVDEPAK